MRRKVTFIALMLCLAGILANPAESSAASQKFRHVARPAAVERQNTADSQALSPEYLEEFRAFVARRDSVRRLEMEVARLDSTIRRDSVVEAYYRRFPLPLGAPLIFSGYRSVAQRGLKSPWLSERQLIQLSGPVRIDPGLQQPVDSLLSEQIPADSLQFDLKETLIEEPQPVTVAQPEIIPSWLATSLRAERIYGDAIYLFMVNNPQYIDNTIWDLPVPPRLPEEDKSFYGYLKRLDLPLVDSAKAIVPDFEQERRYWLHYFNGGLQFSQAFISSNWYQGGNNYLALLFNFTWNVELNTVFKPNLLFQSSLDYKLGINSNPKEAFHRYSISQDNFQYNLKTGFKAFKRWFYSFNLQFKTSLFNAYPEDSHTRSAALLSPGSLNLGLGMTYNYESDSKNFKLSASISPVSYNLKICLADEIDHVQYGIKPGRKTGSEIGSNAEANMMWKIRDNILYTSRIFLFSDYKYFLADWENTLQFNINKFLSTQIYLHPRFDSSSDFNSSKWHYWMFKEILSFGLSYTFSTKP